MRKRMAVLVPTRGRPANAQRLANSCRNTDPGTADLIFGVDRDDPQLHEYLETGFTEMEVGPSVGMCGTLNRMAAQAAQEYDVLGFMGDDHLPQTSRWADMVMGVMDSRPAMPWVVYGDDLLQGENLPTAVFMPSRVVQALGYFAPPQMRHLYLDNFWLELGRELGTLAYLPGMVIEHLHPAAQKANWDDRYAAVNSAHRNDADQAAWLAFRDDPEGLAAAVARVRKEYGA